MTSVYLVERWDYDCECYRVVCAASSIQKANELMRKASEDFESDSMRIKAFKLNELETQCERFRKSVHNSL